MEKKRNIIVVVCVIIGLLGLILLLLSMRTKGRGQENIQSPVKKEQREKYSVSTEAVQRLLEKKPSQLSSGKEPLEVKNPVSAGTAARTGKHISPDTGAAAAPETLGLGNEPGDTSSGIQEDTMAEACAGDTVAPWVYPDPSGGLHRKQIAVRLVSSKPCTIEWKTDSAAQWNIYKGETIPIVQHTILYFQAHDSCGNAMERREEEYDIKPMETQRYCPGDMEYVSEGSARFCIDRFEWPNRKGAIPLSFISIYNAMDSCRAVSKHLCTSDEWTLACTGPHAWKYPYGNSYEPHACVSQDTCSRPSGSKPECRGYFDVFDMAGNLAEWTNTRSSRNPQFYNVNGGFWESGPHTGCFDTHYSYFPQNRHNPVGFRCCKEAAP